MVASQDISKPTVESPDAEGQSVWNSRGMWKLPTPEPPLLAVSS